MDIVITGGAGFLGSALAEQLAAENTLCVIDVNELPPWFPVPNVRFIRADIEKFSDFFECDLIIHTASPVGPVGILSDAGEIGYHIIHSVRQVTRWALARRSRLILISSSEVYGHNGRLSEEAECVFRGPSPSIRNEYAQAKLLSEIMVSNTAKINSDFAYQVIRPFNIAGPRQAPEKGFVLPRFCIQALGGRALTVYGDGSQRRAFTHARDVSRGIIAAMQAKRELYNSVWNIGNPANEITVRELAAMVCKLVGKGSVKYYDPRQLHGPWFTECAEKRPDITKAQSLLGWQPAIPLGAIVSEAVAFWADGNRYLDYLNLI